MIALRREAWRWCIIGYAALRVMRARRLQERAKGLMVDARWERQEAQLLLDAMPPSLMRRR